MHDGSLHWIVITTIGAQEGEINIYDSLYSFLSEKTEIQIASILFYQGKRIKCNFKKFQQQTGGVDCGLFAVAAATHLCHGADPSEFTYDQPLMRRHFLKCLENKHITVFPTKYDDAGFIKKKPIKLRYIEICSECHLPCTGGKNGKDVVKCNSCDKMTHMSCLPSLYIAYRLKDPRCVECKGMQRRRKLLQL